MTHEGHHTVTHRAIFTPLILGTTNVGQERVSLFYDSSINLGVHRVKIPALTIHPTRRNADYETAVTKEDPALRLRTCWKYMEVWVFPDSDPISLISGNFVVASGKLS